MSEVESTLTTPKTVEPSLTFDPVEYLQYLDGMELTDAEAKEILSVLWDMMVQFVDLGFDVEFHSGRASETPMRQPAIEDSGNNRKPKAPNLGEHRR